MLRNSAPSPTHQCETPVPSFHLQQSDTPDEFELQVYTPELTEIPPSNPYRGHNSHTWSNGNSPAESGVQTLLTKPVFRCASRLILQWNGMGGYGV
jgi:hypothetical protein